MKLFFLMRSLSGKNLLMRVLSALELLAGLVIFFLCVSMIASVQSIEKYEKRYPLVAVAAPGSDGEAYACAHGRPLGTFYSHRSSDGLNIRVFSREFLDTVRLDLARGDWFASSKPDAVSVVLPYSASAHYKIGQTVSMYFPKAGRVNVFICGMLKNDVTPANSSPVGIDDINKTAVAFDPSNLLKNDTPPEYLYFLLNDDQSALAASPDAAKQAGLSVLGSYCLEQSAGRSRSIAVPSMFCAILAVMFICAFIGERFLSLAERKQLFAIHYLCGASPAQIFASQLLCDTLWLILPALLSCIAARILSLRLYPAAVLGPVLALLLMLSTLNLVSFLLTFRADQAKLIKGA